MNILPSDHPSQAIGVALDTRRIDKVEEVCTAAINAGRSDLLGYTFNLCQSARNIRPREFRLEVQFRSHTTNERTHLAPYLMNVLFSFVLLLL